MSCPNYDESGDVDWTDDTAISFLRSRGFRLTKEWRWRAPYADRPLTAAESSAIWYLITEWDFGGTIP